MISVFGKFLSIGFKDDIEEIFPDAFGGGKSCAPYQAEIGFKLGWVDAGFAVALVRHASYLAFGYLHALFLKAFFYPCVLESIVKV